MKISLPFLIPIVVSVSTLSSKADVKLPALFSEHAVLQKSAQVPVWGKADPGEQVTVSLGGQSVSATTGVDGKWSVNLDLKNCGQGPFEMLVEGKNKISIPDVVVGEVWVASGQSNMQFILKNFILCKNFH